MKVQRGYKYRLYPTVEQSNLLFNHCYYSNQAWNILVSLQRKEFQLNKNKITLNAKIKIHSQEQLNNERQYLSNVNYDDIIKNILRNRKLDINTKVIQQTRKIFQDNLKIKFKQIDKLKNEYYQKQNEKKLRNPKHIIKPFELFNFKKSGVLGINSFQTTKEQFSIKDYINPITGEINKKYKILRLFRNNFKIRWTRELISDIKTITISFKNNEWYISFSQQLNIKPIDKNRKVKKLGLDINIKDLVLSDKKKISYNLKDKNIIKNNKRLKRLERKQSKRIMKTKQNKTKLGKNYYKGQIKINKIHNKNKNIRNYTLHKVANQLVQHFKDKKINQLNIEDLNVNNMLKKIPYEKYNKKQMKKNIQQSGFSILINMINYKCEHFGIVVKKINPKYSSKLCSTNKCEYINYSLEFERIWHCPKCKKTHDRDINSAKNIEQETKLLKIIDKLKSIK